MPDLAEAIAQALPFGRDMVALTRLPLSPRVERLRLALRDGTVRECIVRRTDRRELALYRQVLTPAETGAPALLGSLLPVPGGTGAPESLLPEPGGTGGDAWLFLELLPEHFLDPADTDHVKAAYHHLGRLHRRFAGRPLPDGLSGGPWALGPADVATVLDAFPGPARHAAEAAKLLAGPPATLVQGDYHRWNIVLADGLVRVLDWEHAAYSHPVWDLVMLEPEGPSTATMPSGAMAETALRTYHAEGPLAHLDWAAFLRLQQTARLFVAARHALAYRARAATAPPGPAAVIEAHARRAEQQVAALAARLGWGHA